MYSRVSILGLKHFITQSDRQEYDATQVSRAMPT